MARKIIVYGTPVSARPVRNFSAILYKSGIPYRYVDIQQDEKATERVKQINDGKARVPTIVFRDGSTLTKPSEKQFIAKLKEAGHTITNPSAYEKISGFLSNPIVGFLGVADIILGSIMTAQNLVYLGFALVGLYVLFGRIIPYFKKSRK